MLLLNGAWALVAVLTLGEKPAAPAYATPMAAHLPAEYALSLGALAVSGLLDGVVKPALGDTLTCRTLDNGARCDPSRLWRWDRSSLGLHHRGWEVVSDVGQGLALGGSVAFVVGHAFLQHRGRPGHDAAVDGVVLLESFVLSHVAGQWLKYAVRRPRPQLYRPGGRRGAESMLSFPSGHTAATASSLTAASTIFWQRHPASPWRYLPPVVTAAATAAVAYGRVAAPKHFATDVLAAAVLGASVGFVVPMLHVAYPERALALHAAIFPAPGHDAARGLMLEGAL